MDINQIENNIEALLNSFTEESFIYGLLSAYGLPNAAVTRLRNGEYNLSKNKNQILWKKRVCYQVQKTGDLHATIDELKKSPAVTKQHPRFLIVTDFNTLLAIDTDNSDTLDIPLQVLSRHFDFFLPWAGMEKSQLQRENPADIKAAERMGRLYDLILEENPIENEEQRHSLNVFFTRLLFCYFAEDTGIFPSGIFVNGIASHTSDDGSDLQSYLFKVFEILNQQDRNKCPAFLAEYPYVNGGLFATSSPVPKFNAKSRKILIECGALNWKAINPDIFGSMMQAVVHTDERSGKGMHYTSVVNIMKVIEPLFLNDLREELENAGDNKQKLQKVLDRIYNIRIFDPACGSGNFLIIAYKELCKLEIEIFKRMSPHGQMSFKFQNKVKISQFYGIEIDDFAHETAKLSLWLAEHQMNLAFRDVFGDARPTLPLQDGGNIYCGNALRLNWQEVVSDAESCELIIIGNPPYIGAKNQNFTQKEDLKLSLKGVSGYRNVDYIAGWFFLAAQMIAKSKSCVCGFVTTNSICQGTQVDILWPSVLKQGIEIAFAYKNFTWSNNAKGKAGVTCSIIGLRKKSDKQKFLFDENRVRLVRNINSYLCDSRDVIIRKHSTSISGLSRLQIGNEPYDGGHLIFTPSEKEHFIAKTPEAERLFKKLVGSSEFIKGVFRWCLWIEDADLNFAMSLPAVRDRIEKVRQSRLKGGMNARSCADRPHQFRWVNRARNIQIVLPVVSSENRKYIPIGFMDRDTIISNKAQVIYDPETYVFGLITSYMHMVWVKTISGRIRSDYQYTANVCYNGFPVPPLDTHQKERISELSFAVLEAREQFPEKSLGELYSPSKMPQLLLAAHKELDLFVDGIYQNQPFSSEEERMECLFKWYEKITKSRKKLESECQISLM